MAAPLERVRDTTLDAYAHQDLPLERILEALDLERDMSHAALFQVFLVLQNLPPAVEMPGLGWRVLPPAVRHVNFDLELWAMERGDGLRLELQYCADLFDAATAEALMTRFERLLAAAVAEPRRPLAELPLLSAAERHQLVAGWGRGGGGAGAGPAPHRRPGAGGGDAAGGGGGDAGRRAAPDLRRAGGAGDGAGRRAGGARRRSRTCRWASAWNARRSRWWRCSPSWSPAAPTCLSTRPTRPSAWR